MWIAIGVLFGLAWFTCGFFAVKLDIAEVPDPVIPGVDEAFRGLMFVAGPAALAAVLFMRKPRP